MYHHQVVVDKMNRYGPQDNPLLRKILSTILFINVVSIMFFISSIIVAFRIVAHYPLYLLGMKDSPYPKEYKLRPFNNFPQVANSPWFVLSTSRSRSII